MMDGKTTVKEMILKITQAFNVDRKTVSQDITAFIRDMLKKGLSESSNFPRIVSH